MTQSLAAFLFFFLGTCLLAQEKARSLPTFSYLLQTAHFTKEDRARAVQELAACDRDVLVIDSSFDGSPGQRWTPEEVTRIREGRPGRKVYSYLSAGEAGTYREYWKKEWDADLDGQPDQGEAPAWLLSANPNWLNNYRVRYWEPTWHRLMAEAVDRMVAQGFDGLWLDTVDTFEFFEHDRENNKWIDNRPNPASGKTYREDMIALIAFMADRARKTKPDFGIATNNGTQLLASKEHAKRLQFVGLENLFTNGKKKQSNDHVKWITQYLDLADKANLPVLLVEYPTKDKLAEWAQAEASKKGYSLLISDKELTGLGEAFLPSSAAE